jgi:hypothetical protein
MSARQFHLSQREPEVTISVNGIWCLPHFYVEFNERSRTAAYQIISDEL